MKKTIKRFLCVVMCFVLILPFALSAAAAVLGVLSQMK